MNGLRVETAIVGWTQEEWEQIGAAARCLEAAQVPAATLVFPGRPELYRLDRKPGGRFRLRLTTCEELAATMRAEAGARS